MKTVRHYKRIDNALLRNLGEKIFCPAIGIMQWGSTWLASGYFPDRSKPCTLIYDDFRNQWELIID